MEHRDDKMHPDYTRCLVSELHLVKSNSETSNTPVWWALVSLLKGEQWRTSSPVSCQTESLLQSVWVVGKYISVCRSCYEIYYSSFTVAIKKKKNPPTLRPPAEHTSVRLLLPAVPLDDTHNCFVILQLEEKKNSN